MALDQDIEQEAARMADKVTQDMARLITDRSSFGTATINANVHNEGRGTWIAASCCAVMLAVVAVCIGFYIRDSNRMYSEISDIRKHHDSDVQEMHATESKMQAYLNVIYQKAPYLKPENNHGK